jgi:hypothetical protein
MTKDTVISEDMYIVSVDSRGHSPSDLECYKEQTCSHAFFNEHIRNNPKNICVKSQVAGHCGLDLKMYFHEHPESHVRYSDKYQGLSPLGRTNGIATLLTFNPDTGYYNHIVRGKTYIVMNNGMTPLSKRQVWGIQEFIREAKEVYHKDGGQYSHEAKIQLLKSAYAYLQEMWAPHSIYEIRHPRRHYFSQYRLESGMSDQATCHHGCTHAHHDGHHDCCHHKDHLLSDDPTDAIKNHHRVSFSLDQEEPTVEQQEDRENDGARYNHNIDYKFYSKICH